ncbi:MAG: hypothetical protein WCX33_01090, partial [Candidatus Shapirobacteria bacterium]
MKIKEILELNSKFFLVLDLEKLKDVIIPRDYAANVKLVAVKPGFSIHKQGETRIMHFTSFVDDELSPLEIHKGGFPSEEWIKDYILIEPDQQFLLVNITSKEYRGKIINQMIDSRHVAFDWDGEEMYDVRSYPSHDPKVKFIVCFDE